MNKHLKLQFPFKSTKSWNIFTLLLVGGSGGWVFERRLRLYQSHLAGVGAGAETGNFKENLSVHKVFHYAREAFMSMLMRPSSM